MGNYDAFCYHKDNYELDKFLCAKIYEFQDKIKCVFPLCKTTNGISTYFKVFQISFYIKFM